MLLFCQKFTFILMESQQMHLLPARFTNYERFLVVLCQFAQIFNSFTFNKNIFIPNSDYTPMNDIKTNLLLTQLTMLVDRARPTYNNKSVRHFLYEYYGQAQPTS